MTVTCGGDPFGKIHYLDSSSIDSHPDVVLVSSEGETFQTSRLILASVSEMFRNLVSLPNEKEI
jgi:hypothetical protein